MRPLVLASLAVLSLAASASAIAVRRPDVFTRPQFWAEDGFEWYARAYNEPGVANLVRSYGGYLQVFPRFAGLASQQVALAEAPLLMAALALLVQMIAPVFLLSERFAWAVPRRWQRGVLALLLVAAPNLMEVHVNVTNGQVHLALLAFLVLLAAPRASLAWRGFDVAVLLLSGFSGPFCLLLLPVAVLCWWQRRDAWTGVRLLAVLLPFLIQGAALAPRATPPSSTTSPGFVLRAPHSPHGATVGNLLDIFGGQIVVGSLTGVWTYARLHAGLFAEHPWLPAAIGAAGLAFLARAAWVTTSFALRLLLLFATLHMAAGLTSPIILGDRPLWEMLALPGAGQRYYYSMTLAFLATLVWTIALDRRRAMRVLAGTLLAVLAVVGIPGDFFLPPRPDLDFPAQARAFAGKPPGKLGRFRIPPEPSTMVLVRGCEPPHVPLKPRQEARLRARRACPEP